MMMMKNNRLKLKPFLMLILIHIIKADGEIDDPNCNQLPNGCQLKSYIYSINYQKAYLYECKKLSQSFKFDHDQIETIRNCSSNVYINRALENIYFRLDEPSIVDDSFDLPNSELFLKQTWRLLFRIIFRFVLGFDIGLNPFVAENLNSNYLHFWYSKFDFYSNGKLIKSCSDIESTPRSIFNVYEPTDKDVYFYNSEYKTSICPLLFTNFSNKILRLYRISNTFYRSNYPKFSPILDTSITDIHSNIAQLYLYYIQEINLDSTILNELAFKNIERLFISGGINSIQIGLLKSFKRLRSIVLDGYSTRKLIHRGIDWILDINSELKVDLHSHNASHLLTNNSLSSWCVSFRTTPADKIGFDYDVNAFKPVDLYPDEDFCLYRSFPFEQLIVFLPHKTKSNFSLSCTYIWLIQYHVLFSQICRVQKFAIKDLLVDDLNEQVIKCNFKRRLIDCNRSQFEIQKPAGNIDSVYDLIEKLYLLQFIIIILTPVISIFGITMNLLIVKTISDKENKKSLKETQYKYMRLNAIVNALILTIEPILLISECKEYKAMFCSTIRFSQFSQYFKIIFGEYFSNLLRLASNLIYVQFTLNRLSLIGKKNEKLTIKESRLTMSQFLAVIIIPCSLLSVVKIFRFIPNNVIIDADYPNSIGHFFKFFDHSIVYVYLSFNALFDIINYVAFLVINFFIDVNLAITLKKTIDEKKKNKAKASRATDKNDKKSENPITRTVIMVILNASLGLMLKIPSAYASMFDLVNLIKNLPTFKNTVYNLYQDNEFYCSYYHVCYSLEKTGNFLYLISISINLIFFYKFDKNFKSSFIKLLKR